MAKSKVPILHHSKKSLYHISKYPSSPKSKSKIYYYKGSNLFRLSNIEFKKRLLKTAETNPLNVIQIYRILGYMGNYERNLSKLRICEHIINSKWEFRVEPIKE